VKKINFFKSSVISFIFLFVAALSVLSLSSCKKDDSMKDSSVKDSTIKNKSSDNQKKEMDHNMSNMMNKKMDNMMNKMHEMKMTGNLDIDFVTMMIIHHQGAIDMAETEIASGKNEKIKSMAGNIVTDQKKEISTMQNWLDKNKDMKSVSGDNSKKLMASMMGMMNPDMKMSGDTDKDFLAMMIIHHEGAIDMSEVEINSGNNKEIKKMAQEIVKKQKAEMEQMKEWQK